MMDGPLRRHILLKRTPARLQSSLSDRPSRDTLAKRNILRGVNIRQHIQEGNYIGGPIAVRTYHVSCQLERQLVSIQISKKLKTRPNWAMLVERGLIPEEMLVSQENIFQPLSGYRFMCQPDDGSSLIPGSVSTLAPAAVTEEALYPTYFCLQKSSSTLSPNVNSDPLHMAMGCHLFHILWKRHSPMELKQSLKIVSV
ncbi:hypothetical protein BX616_004123 [Lobosporangium transversale]|nr:hypothetical protein BX616_004123 [Lobosporangium transversale]